jgi:hypothetical protein
VNFADNENPNFQWKNFWVFIFVRSFSLVDFKGAFVFVLVPGKPRGFP